ncbi:MAG: DNA polymerase I [Termitinemataceae bacterium]|nr:MAG: DNA polymerase I [Termitinemataceae bacterium]
MKELTTGELKPKDPLYIIDAYALIYRSYFAFINKPLKNPNGQNISALFGFARTVLYFIKNIKTSCLVAAYDPKGQTFRHKKYPLYKITRQKAPEDLHAQVPLTEEFLNALGIGILKVDNYEADDIIASLVKICKQEKRECYIISGDKDLLQLVGEGVWEIRQSKKNSTGSEPYEKIGYDEVKAEWGVEPCQILDLLSLIGDKSDNVPGVSGIGDKGAVKLITRFGSLDEIYKNIAAIEGITGRKLAEGKESAYLSRDLITLFCDIPLNMESIDSFSIKNIDTKSAALMLLREGIPSIAKELLPEDGVRRKNKDAEEIDVLSGNEINIISGNYKTVTAIDEVKKIIDRALEKKYITLDFETNSLDVRTAIPLGISFALTEGEAFYVPLAACKDSNVFASPAEIKKILESIFYNPDFTVIAHNVKFDLEIARAWGFGIFKCKIWDTMLAAWLCDPARAAYNLETLSAFYLRLKGISFSQIVAKGSTFSDVPIDVATQYSCEDSDLCLRLKNFLEKKLITIDAEKLFYQIEMPLLPILAEMETTGIKIDPEYLRKYGTELATDIAKIENTTYQTVGHEFNLSSPKQLQEVLFNERGLKPGKKTKTGYSTDVAVLEELAAIDVVPEMILRHRTLSKLKSTYVDTLANLADNEGRLHTSFNQTGTATGRLSSRDPNLQNIPIREEEGRRIREAFIAEEGNVLISADYNQIELVVLAHLSGDTALLDAFTAGKDVHARTAALIFGIPEESVDQTQRRMAKTINFGVMYGMSAFRLSNELSISRSDASNFIDAYFKTYSGVRKYIDGLISKAEETGYATTLFGRRRFIYGINSQNKTEKSGACRIAVNTPIQGSAADIVKLAMINLDAKLHETKSPARLLLQVHDELILECPKENAKEISTLVGSVMENAVSLKIPLRVTIETGMRWGDFH